MQRLLALALEKVLSSCEFAEEVIVSMLDAIMGMAVEVHPKE